MAPNILKCNYLMPLHFKGLIARNDCNCLQLHADSHNNIYDQWFSAACRTLENDAEFHSTAK